MSEQAERAKTYRAAYGAGYRDGFEAAVQDMFASSDHWQQCYVKREILGAIRDTADAVRSGWYCAEPGHTHPACLARKDEVARRTVATEPVEE